MCSGFVFLRLLCPAILNPKQFNLITGIIHCVRKNGSVNVNAFLQFLVGTHYFDMPCHLRVKFVFEITYKYVVLT